MNQHAHQSKTAVVVGATGIVGQGIASALSKEGSWRVVAVSRSGALVLGANEALAVNLLDAEESRAKLSAIPATHLFYAAYQPKPTWFEEVAPNRALFVNAVEGLEAAGASLEHVTLVTGAKYYGVHLGPSPTPARETDSRHFGPNFYYAQEDYLRSRSDAKWTWTHLIPTHLTGFATGNPMNLALAVGVYASLVRASGLRFDFPGTSAAFEAMTQIVDADQLGAAAIWSATSESARGETFNVANGDPTRWSQLWPEIAEYFGLSAGGSRPLPISTMMPELSDVWAGLAGRNRLKHRDLNALVNWRFLEFVLSIDYDVVLSLGKIRRAGFAQQPDTMDGFRGRFDQYVQDGILPKP